MRRGKKWMAALGAAAVVMAALSGCGRSASTQTSGGTQAAQESKETASGETSAAAEETKNVNDDGTVNNPEQVAVDANKLVMWSLFSGGDGGFMSKMIEEYNGTNPTKQVQSIMLVWADYYTKLQTAVAAGKGPDIGISHASSLPQLVEDGVVQPITSYLDELGIDLSQHYSQASIDAVTFGGEVYAVPLDTHAEIMYFNKGILEQAGVALNGAGGVDIKNADDFYAICDKIKAVIPEDGSTIAITSNGDDPYRLWWAAYFQMGGAPIVSDDGKSVTLDKEKAVKAAEFVKGLYDKGYVKEGIDDHQKFFQSGKAGICIGGTWAVGAFEQTDNLNFVPVAFPKLFDTDNCWADSHTFILPAKKARNEADSKAAVEFMAAASMKGGVTWASSGQIPACKEVLASDEYKALPYRSSYMSEVEKAVLPAKVSTFNGMKKGMIDSLDTIWTGKGDAASGIDALYDELESNLP
ncbi:extracellular solute-binding protein [Lacrimispora saccharolytica]|uniref:Extracellular solute-binding protein family 1 n=1 Tax=Lacrimispora saccharolytica (strain ATCC 35040 / DSM 2544 / NRCC 2533 / WM1) TaxID=610130 RepID=D9R9T5_LACSW|nr:extracellular solute-binding protein [Lacrimispora saccharolytica]ADL04135.1 extracellular solute-binding protein family 1 [[Clostridium] saccharolyticum WM1]